MRYVASLALVVVLAACGGGSSDSPDSVPEAKSFDFRTCMEAAATVGDENTCENTQADIEASVDAAVDAECPVSLGFNDFRECFDRVSADARTNAEADAGTG